MAATDYPTHSDLLAAADRAGVEIEEYATWPTQGTIISWSRPVRDGETFMGLPVAGPCVRSEVIERHYCPVLPAEPDVIRVTEGRAVQRAIWQLEDEAEEARRAR